MTQQQWRNALTWGSLDPRGQGAGWQQVAGRRGPATFARAPQGPGFGVPQLGQGPYPPGQFQPPRIRRRHPLRGFLLAVLAITLVAFVGLVLTNLVSAPSQVPYQNESYQVPPPDKNPPPLPVPETYAEAQQVISGSTFYRQTAPAPVRCGAQPINVATADDSQLQSHFESLMECLVRVWQPPVENAGFQIVRPTVTIYGREVTTKCGKAPVNAFYCSGDQQVYFSALLPDYVSIVKRDKWAADVVMAHEFGHALQARTAILVSANALSAQSGSKDTELELSRRLETQADCLAGMFTRSVSDSMGIQPSDQAGIEDTFSAVGDDTLTGKASVVGNHGLAKSRRYWGSTGLGTSSVAACNTFTAPRKLVR